jgi:ATP-binding cassette subfamily B protein
MGAGQGSEMNRKISIESQLVVYKKINSIQGIAPFETPNFQDTIQLAVQGAQFGPQQMLGIVIMLGSNLLSLVSFLGVLIVFSPILTALVLLAVVPELIFQIRLGQERFNLNVQQSPKERRASYFASVLSGVGFASEIRLFNLGDFFLNVFHKLSIENQDVRRKQQIHEIRCQTIPSVLTSLITAGTFLAVIGSALKGNLSLGSIAFYSSAVDNILGSMSGIILSIANLNELSLTYECFTDMLKISQPIKIQMPTKEMQPLKKGVFIHDVYFRYSEGLPWVLNGLSLDIPVGKCVALVGENGSGKTTLVKLLTRLYDSNDGIIYWDDINISAFDPRELRQQISVVLQNFVRYELSIQENIGVGNLAVLSSMNHLVSAAQRAGIHSTIKELPHGYQTLLSRNFATDGFGIDLSGGQWQKIALARSFVRQGELIILDEPLSALDPQAEHEMLDCFTKLIAGKTSLIITHRLNAVHIADLIAVIDQGKIIEFGSHDELIKLGGTYARLYAMQAQSFKV